MMEENIYQEERELERLRIQEQLLAPYEIPVYDKVLDHSGMIVLDIGSNDGTKIRNRFWNAKVEKLIGLERQDALTQTARRNCPEQRFSFYTCDVESDDFETELQTIMNAEGVCGFDLIHLSYVLVHLKEPKKLLKRLRKYLLPGGRLFVAEVDDSSSAVLPDKGGLFETFLSLLQLDPFSGDRMCGAKLPALLEEAGYVHIVQERDVLRAEGSDTEKKAEMFEVFCSYLAEDLKGLLREEPDRADYRQAQQWLEQNYERMRDEIVHSDVEFVMGERIMTCTADQACTADRTDVAGRTHTADRTDAAEATSAARAAIAVGNGWTMRRMGAADVEQATVLCDQCVGKNLYSAEYLSSILTNPQHCFYLMITDEGEPAGYIYFILMDEKELASYCKPAAKKLGRIYEESESLTEPLENRGRIIGNLRSIGVKDAYRSMGLAKELNRFAFERLAAMGAELVIIFCWKIKGVVYTRKMLLGYGMRHLLDVPRMWYNEKNLICPYCGGRCTCDAEVYYMRLDEIQLQDGAARRGLQDDKA